MPLSVVIEHAAFAVLLCAAKASAIVAASKAVEFRNLFLKDIEVVFFMYLILLCVWETLICLR